MQCTHTSTPSSIDINVITAYPLPLIDTNMRLFLCYGIIAYPPPSSLDTNVRLFLRNGVIAYPPSPIDTNVSQELGSSYLSIVFH